MIKFIRSNIPDCLSETNKEGLPNFKRWNKAWCHKISKTPTTGTFPWHKFKGEKVNEILIESLRISSKSHCAFCDKYAPEDDSDSIEHFYPKKLFCNQAFSWENLFLSCNGCQKSPIGWKKREVSHRHLILKPDDPDYSFSKFFIFNSKNGEILINPWETTNEEQEKAKTTMFYYKFNDFKRPQIRHRNFEKIYDSSSENNISPSCLSTIDELPYRFIYL